MAQSLVQVVHKLHHLDQMSLVLLVVVQQPKHLHQMPLVVLVVRLLVDHLLRLLVLVPAEESLLKERFVDVHLLFHASVWLFLQYPSM